MPPARAAAELQAIHGFLRVLEGQPGVAAAWEALVRKHSVSGKQAHDAHLVAVMQVYGVTGILTFNVADFRRYPGIQVLDPAQF